MGKKFYAVKAGKVPGIYKTWNECKEQVDGFSGAMYKGFATEQEAKEFLGIDGTDRGKTPSHLCAASEAISYVDGSYNSETNEFAYGVVFFSKGKETHYSEKFNDDKLAEMHNVAGEIKGAEKAMQICIEEGIKSIDIYYDYQGIAAWCTGDWKANKEGTKAYKAYFDSLKPRLSVKFIKVEGHSGDIYNDLADSLAKSALGLKGSDKTIKENENSITANHIQLADLKKIFDLLTKDFSDLLVEQKSIPYGTGFSLTVNKPNKQRVQVNHITSKDKICLQGRKEELFCKLTLYIVELLRVDEVPAFLNTVHNLNVDKDQVETDFDKYLPRANGKLPSKINNYLHQAVYNLSISGDVFNATFLAEPAIRPLEAVLKIALKEHHIPIRKAGEHYDSFFVFRKSRDDIYTLKREFIQPEHSAQLIEYLTKSYNYFHKNRHTIDHWDDPTAPIDTTRVISTVEEAHTLIKESLSIIDEYYSL